MLELKKKEFHKSKQPIDLSLINADQIVVSDKCKHSDDSFKYCIGYKEGEIVKPFYIILPKLSGYIKYLENEGKDMSFMVKNENVLDNYNEIWDKIKENLNVKFHSTPFYDEKYIKTKVREFHSVIKTNFMGNIVPKENEHCTCIASVTIDFVMRMEKKNYPQVYLEECKYRIKKKKNNQVHRSWTKTRVRIRVRARVRFWR